MFCKECGAQLSDGAKFCHRCGAWQETQQEVVHSTTSSRSSNKRLRRLMLGCAGGAFLALFLCSAAALVLYFWFGFNQLDQAQTLAPAEETTAFASISPSPLQLVYFWRLRDLSETAPALAPFVLVPGVTEAVQVAQRHLALDLQVDPMTDILPWIGPQISVVALEEREEAQDPSTRLGQRGKQLAGAYDGPPLVLTVATRNPNRTITFLAQVRHQMERDGVVFVNSVYQDVLITEVEEPAQLPLAYATFGGMFVLTTDASTLRRAIDTASGNGAGRLVDAPDFQETLAELPSNRLGFVYLDAQKVAEQMNLPTQLWQIHSARNVGLSVALHRDGVRFDYVVDFDVSDLNRSQIAWLELPEVQSRLAGQVPANCLFYFSGQNLLLLLESYLGEEFETLVRELERETRFSQGNSLIEFLEGEYAVALIDDRRGIFADLPVSLLLYREAEDLREAEDTLQDLGDTAADLMGVSFHRDEVNRVPVWLLEDPDTSEVIGYGVNGSTVFIGTSYNALRAAIQSRQSSLASSSLFQKATTPLPDKFREQLYLDVQQLLRTVERSRLDDLYDDDVWSYMQAIDAVSMTIAPLDTGDGLLGSLFVVTGE